jgi:hypothetical protein
MLDRIDFFAPFCGENRELQHRKLPTKSDAERMKACWAERLEALAAVMTR